MTGNVRKRASAPKYTTGLGDGHVAVPADTDLHAEAGNAVLQKMQSLRARNNIRHHIVVKAPDGNVKFGEPEARYRFVHSDDPGKIGANQHQRLHSKTQRHDRLIQHFLETPVMVLGAAVFIVMVSAIFIHLISSGGNQEARKNLHSRTLKKKNSKPHSRIRKKKTDEWNEDAEEDYLLSESVRNGGSTEVDDAKPVYYPYQPRLQQHRHRKNSSSSQSGPVIVAQANQQASVQHRNYYLNQSGAVIGGFGSSNIQMSPGTGVPQHTPGKSASSRTLGSNYSPDVHQNVRPQSARDLALAYPSLQQQQHEAHLKQEYMAYPTSGIVARPLSTTAESFESLTRSYDDESQEYVDNFLSSGRFSPQRSPCSSGQQKQKFTVLGSPIPASNSDHDESGTPKFSHSRCIDLVEKTPRIANGRAIFPIMTTMQPSVPEHSPLLVRELLPRSSDEDSVDLQFAAPLDMRRRSPHARKTVDEETPRVPFVPVLDVHVARTRPPRSMNMDDLHIYQKMESGDVSHWEAFVADETRQLEEQVFPEPVSDDVQTAMMESAASSSVTATSQDDSIPPGDPRKSIQHKRKDLTDASNASASLQGTIDFDELKLIEIIGGGGFGQVWKAMWRGTPVAVKVLTGSAQSQSVPRAVLEEFVAEINLLRGMRHPNICLYMGACLKPPNRAIITELAANGSLWDALRLPLAPPYAPCDGLTKEGWPMSLYQPDSKHGVPPASFKSGSLSSVPPRGTWHWILVKRVACGAARGMAYLHSGTPPILHRDLKSANILLDDSYTAKVCDFGLSRIRAQESSMTGNVGTVQWMPPEVLANQSYNEKADVYSYGIICWELLTRECPYDKMTPIQCALAVLNRNQRPEIPKWCPPALQALIRSCIKKDPDERPSFTGILDALDMMP